MLRLYYMNIECGCSKEQFRALYEILPVKRKELVDCSRNEEIAMKRLCAGAFLQYVLSKETGIPMGEIQYRYNAWGKPELDVTMTAGVEKPYFNLSHSGRYAVLAVSDSPIGVDVEHKRKNYRNLAKRCFCRQEYEDIISQDTELERQQCFLQYWTMKEAYIKCLGEGLRIPLDSFLIHRRDYGISSVADRNMWFGSFSFEAYCVSICSNKWKDIEETVKQRENIERISIDNIYCAII